MTTTLDSSRTSDPHKPLSARASTLFIFLANGFGIGAWAAEVPRIKASLGLTDTALGIALFAFALGAIIAMPLAGQLAPRLGGNRAALLLGVLFAAMLSLPALAPNLTVLFVVLLLLGASNGALDVSMNGFASVVETRWGTPIMSSFHAAWSAGGLLGAASGAMLQKAGIGVIGGLAFPAGLIGILIIVALVLGWRDRQLGGVQPAPAESGSSSGFAWPSAGVMKLAMFAFLCMLVEGAVADWSAVYLHATLQREASAAALGYAAFALSMAACRMVGDLAVRHFGVSRVIAWGGLISVTGFALVLLWPTLLTACVGFAMVGIGIANIVPVIFSAAGRSTHPPAVGMSMAATAGYGGFLVGPPFIGLGAGLVGLRAALCVLVLATALVALFGGRIVRRT